MRQIASSLILVAALAAGLAAAGPALAQTKKPAAARTAKPKAAPEPPPPAYVPQERMKTSDEAKTEGIKGAATTPLRDLGVEKTEIPELLLQALTDPYARPPKGYGCAYLIGMIRPLDDVLGTDIDLSPPGDENLVDRGKALGVAADVATSALIPFRGVVRQISGAASHDRLVQSAYVAGSVRRAYLKGLGESRGCLPPATPSHERAGSAPAVDKREMPKPKYPTREEPAAPQTTAGTPPPALR